MNIESSRTMLKFTKKNMHFEENWHLCMIMPFLCKIRPFLTAVNDLLFDSMNPKLRNNANIDRFFIFMRFSRRQL